MTVTEMGAWNSQLLFGIIKKIQRGEGVDTFFLNGNLHHEVRRLQGKFFLHNK